MLASDMNKTEVKLELTLILKFYCEPIPPFIGLISLKNGFSAIVPCFVYFYYFAQGEDELCKISLQQWIDLEAFTIYCFLVNLELELRLVT